MSAMISLSKLSNSSNVNVNVKPNVNVNVGNNTDGCLKRSEISTTKESNEDNIYSASPSSDVYVSYSDDKYKALYEELYNKCEVLKLIIDMLQNNPIMYNGYIIADDEKLMKFIQLLTGADDVQLDADDLGQGCITKKTYRKIHAIYVIKDNETKNLKYDYPKVMKELTDLGISTKFIW